MGRRAEWLKRTVSEAPLMTTRSDDPRERRLCGAPAVPAYTLRRRNRSSIGHESTSLLTRSLVARRCECARTSSIRSSFVANDRKIGPSTRRSLRRTRCLKRRDDEAERQLKLKTQSDCLLQRQLSLRPAKVDARDCRAHRFGRSCERPEPGASFAHRLPAPYRPASRLGRAASRVPSTRHTRQ
jgi:hypothetical protein